MNSQQHKRIKYIKRYIRTVRLFRQYSFPHSETIPGSQPLYPGLSRLHELGYMKNIIASSMRSGHTNLIAVIVDDIQNPHYSDIISQISNKLRKIWISYFNFSIIHEKFKIIHCPSHYLIMLVESFFHEL